MRLRWTPRALRDIDEIGAYIAAEDSLAAERVVARVVEAAERLAALPQSGRPGRVAETRELVVTGLPYILVHMIGEEEIAILSIMHTARLWPRRF
jgi:toxin ParE1/3/4